MEFPGMTSGRGHLPLYEPEDEWKYIHNLDLFFKELYNYYSSKGIAAIILSEVCGVISLGFTVVFSVFLIAFIDWSALSHCKDEHSCSADQNIIGHNPFRETPGLWNIMISLYFLIFGGMWCWKCWSAYNNVLQGFEMEKFYREKLGIKYQDLCDIAWFQVIDRLITLHDHGALRIVMKDKLELHDIVLRIMRKDNYMIALMNMNCLDLYVPWWLAPFTTENMILTKSLEWALSFCIMEHMFTEDFEVSETFLNDVEGLKFRFQVVGLILFLMMPFTLIFMVIHFFLQNAQQFHSSRAYLGPRQWTALALWQYREFNELPHVFEERMNKAFTPGVEYLSSFHNHYLIIIAKCLGYISGAIVGSLLLISVISDSALLYLHVADYNLLWYLGIFSAFYAASRAIIPDETKAKDTPEQLLNRMCSETHSFPEKWAGKAHTTQVRDEVSDLLQFKIQVFLMEMLSSLLTPMILFFSLPSCAPSVLGFLRSHTEYVDGIGAVCDYCLFDFAKYGDENFGAVSPLENVEPREKLHDGKFEKSFLNFQQTYPTFFPNQGAKQFVDRFEAYKGARNHEMSQLFQSALGNSLHKPNFPYPPQEAFRSNSGHSTNHSDTNQEEVSPTTSIPFPSGLVREQSNDMEYEYDKSGMAAFATKPSLVTSTYIGGLGYEAHSPAMSEGENISPIMKPPMLQRQSSDDVAGMLAKPSKIELSQFPQGMYSTQLQDTFRSPGSATDLPSVLMSVFRQQNIDYQNDFYWLAKFQHDKFTDPQELEHSIAMYQSQKMGSPPLSRGGGGIPRSGSLPNNLHDRSKMFSPVMSSMNISTGGGSGEFSPGRAKGLLPPWSPPTSRVKSIQSTKK